MNKIVTLGLCAILVSGCNAFDRLVSIGETPKLSTIDNPTTAPDYRPVTMPMPAVSMQDRQPNSLWQTGGRAFFRDQRAARVGDILTVIVSINDQAQLQNATTRSRDNTETADATNLLGFEGKLNKLLPNGVDPTSLIDTSSTTSNTGKGTIARQEQIDMRVAATIIQVLPNGNFVIQGKQQVSVNFDMRELNISGIIRSQDISSDNTISYDQIAEARVEYGGKGTMSDVQQPRYGTQLIDILMPF